MWLVRGRSFARVNGLLAGQYGPRLSRRRKINEKFALSGYFNEKTN